MRLGVRSYYMKRSIICAFLFIAFYTATAQFKNIRLAELTDEIYLPIGPGIAINRKNTNNIVAGVGSDREGD